MVPEGLPGLARSPRGNAHFLVLLDAVRGPVEMLWNLDAAVPPLMSLSVMQPGLQH